MNKNVLLGIGGIVVAGIGFGIYKFINKKSEEPVEEVVKENASEIVTEEKDEDEFLERMMAEEKEVEEATKNWTEREEKCRKEISEKTSVKDQNMFTDDVSKSSEFEALNKIREASGKEPLKVSEQFEKFLGKDSDKSVKESLDSIAENIKKDPEFKNKILGILQE
nr:MAG TPA: hypothetical protein [Caudoviricetes sp.]